MSNAMVQFRSNENSSLYNTIKSRNSKLNVFDYSVEGEVNSCEFVQSRIKINPTTTLAAAGNQTIRYELSNFGFLTDLYLQTSFTKGGTNADGSNDNFLVDHAGAWAWSRCRCVYNGQTVAEITPDFVLASMYSRASAEESVQLDKMLGGSPTGAAGAIGAVEGRRALAALNGGQTLSCPLKFWFSESLGKAWDLYSLSSRAYIEVDYKSAAEVQTVADTGPCNFSDSQLIAYVAQMAPLQLQAYQSRNYAPNSVSSQLGFTTSLFSDAIGTPILTTATSSVGNKVKIQSISGLVRRLHVYATTDSVRASATAKEYSATIDIAECKLLGNNQEIYDLGHCAVGADNVNESDAATVGAGYHTDNAVEIFHNKLHMSCNRLNAVSSDTFKLYDPVVDASLGSVGGGNWTPAHVKTFNFGTGSKDYASADGCISLSQISSPEIEVKFPHTSAGATTLHVLAEIVVLNTYSVSQSGAITFKMITE